MPVRARNYRDLKNPFTPQRIFSDDQVNALHENALRVLGELGLKVLLPEAREHYRAAGALVDETTEMVRIGSEIVAEALRTAPSEFTLRGGVSEADIRFHPDALVFLPGAGCPNATDRLRGRRPGSMRDFRELSRIVAGYDVMHAQSAVVEPQDVPAHLRHFATMRHQLLSSPKVPFVFSRGRAQVEDSFRMIRIWRGLSEEEFRAEPFTKTIINTNSPRQLDRPMAQGIIDHARWGQMTVVTPFCMLGAMAPVTVAGALSLQHAEALAGIVLNQLVSPGAPVMYGNFASNVDLKSGAPAFGTPEHVKATIGSGQLARHIGLTWRSAAGCAGNANDAQAAHETEISCWAAVLAGATMIVHSAGWMEGGLTLGYEKLVTDMEMVQIITELCTSSVVDEAELSFEAIREVQPGGHFFGTRQTLERFHTAFYEPRSWDLSNFGTWSENGAMTTDERATQIWQERLAAHQDPPPDSERLELLDAFIARRTAEGGAPPGE